MPTYKLVYFNGRGRAETIRLAFHLSGIKFEDVRVAKEDWPQLKPKTPFGQVPYLEVDGKFLTESVAIARFVGREGGLMGKCNFDQALIDAVIDFLNGFGEKMYVAKMSPEGPQKEVLMKEFLDKHLPEAAKHLEKTMGNKKYLVLDEASLADLHFFSIFEFMGNFVNWQDLHPKLKELYERVKCHPKLADYFKNRPVTEF